NYGTEFYKSELRILVVSGQCSVVSVQCSVFSSWLFTILSLQKFHHFVVHLGAFINSAEERCARPLSKNWNHCSRMSRGGKGRFYFIVIASVRSQRVASGFMVGSNNY